MNIYEKQHPAEKRACSITYGNIMTAEKRWPGPLLIPPVQMAIKGKVSLLHGPCRNPLWAFQIVASIAHKRASSQITQYSTDFSSLWSNAGYKIWILLWRSKLPRHFLVIIQSVHLLQTQTFKLTLLHLVCLKFLAHWYLPLRSVCLWL